MWIFLKKVSPSLKSKCWDFHFQRISLQSPSLFWELREPCTSGAERLKESKREEDSKRAWPSEPAKQGTHGLTETKAPNRWSACVCIRISACVLLLGAWCLCGKPNSASSYYSFAWSWDSSLLLGCVVQPSNERCCLVFLHIFWCVSLLSFVSLPFSEGNSRGSESGVCVGISGGWNVERREGRSCGQYERRIYFQFESISVWKYDQ